MPALVVQLTSDQARALLCCAEQGLNVAHSPDLFHGQRDLLQPLLLPLQRPIRQAAKELEQAQQRTLKLDVPAAQASPQQVVAISAAVRQELALEELWSKRGSDSSRPWSKCVAWPTTTILSIAAAVGR